MVKKYFCEGDVDVGDQEDEERCPDGDGHGDGLTQLDAKPGIVNFFIIAKDISET